MKVEIGDLFEFIDTAGIPPKQCLCTVIEKRHGLGGVIYELVWFDDWCRINLASRMEKCTFEMYWRKLS